MRHSVVLLFTAVLATTTGIALLGASLLLAKPAVGVPALASTGPITAFVAAVNQVLQTGDATALDTVVAADFIDHGPASVFGPDRLSLARYLRTLRATYPDLEIAMDDTLVSGPRVSVRLTAHGHRIQSFLGIPLPGRTAGWTTIDLFRIEHGVVAEHWGGDSGVNLYQSLLARPEEMPIDNVVAITVARLRPLGQMTIPVTLPGDAVVVVEEGEVGAHSDEEWRITRAGDDTTTAITPGFDLMLHPGDIAFLPAGSSTVRASDPRSSFIVAVAILASTVTKTERSEKYQPDPESGEGGLVAAMLHSGTGGPVAAEGMLVERLARLRPPATMADDVGLDLGRVILRPGASLHLRSDAATWGITIETGEIELDPIGGRLEIQQSPVEGTLAPSLHIGEAVTLATGDAVIVPKDHDAELRNTGDVPTVILIAVLESTDAVASSSPPTPVAYTGGMPLSSLKVQAPSSTPTPGAIASPASSSAPDDGPARGHPS